MPALLFVTSVFAWGATWYPMKVAVGVAPVPTTMLWRFIIAGGISMLILAATGRLRRPRGAEWFWLWLLALFIFSTNFMLFGHVARLIPSGLVSVLFATATIANAVNSRIFFGEPIGLRMSLAALIGLSGLLLMFAPDLALGTDPARLRQTVLAIGLGLLGSVVFSLGNMVSRRNSAAGMGLIWANGWGMCLGSVILAGLTLASGADPLPPMRLDWWASVLFLAIIGSVVGFAAYLGLVARIGPNRAAYATVLFPVMALWISWLIEGYQWHLPAIAGLGLVTAGNVLAFTRGRVRLPARAPLA